jgi:uncharacterized protein YuzE
MRTIYDERTDSLFVRLADTPVDESEEVSPGVVIDYDAEGRIVAIEILTASKNVSGKAVLGQLAAA